MRVGGSSSGRPVQFAGDRRVLDERAELLVEGLAAQFEPGDDALWVDEEGGGDRVHAERLDEVGAGAGVVDLPPGEVARPGEIDDGRLRLVEADADDLEAPLAILGVSGLESGQLGDARRAPGGPEVDQDVL